MPCNIGPLFWGLVPNPRFILFSRWAEDRRNKFPGAWKSYDFSSFLSGGQFYRRLPMFSKIKIFYYTYLCFSWAFRFHGSQVYHFPIQLRLDFSWEILRNNGRRFPISLSAAARNSDRVSLLFSGILIFIGGTFVRALSLLFLCNFECHFYTSFNASMFVPQLFCLR